MNRRDPRAPRSWGRQLGSMLVKAIAGIALASLFALLAGTGIMRDEGGDIIDPDGALAGMMMGVAMASWAVAVPGLGLSDSGLRRRGAPGLLLLAGLLCALALLAAMVLWSLVALPDGGTFALYPGDPLALLQVSAIAVTGYLWTSAALLAFQPHHRHPGLLGIVLILVAAMGTAFGAAFTLEAPPDPLVLAVWSIPALGGLIGVPLLALRWGAPREDGSGPSRGGRPPSGAR